MNTIKYILLVLILFTKSVNLSGQITIQKNDFPLNLSADTLKIVTNFSELNKPEHGQDVKWDYSHIKAGSDIIRTYYPGDNIYFPNSDRQEKFSINIGTQINLEIMNQHVNTANGYYLSGLYSPADTFPLGSITFNNNDTFFWHEQIITDQLLLLGYPLEENAIFYSEATFKMDFTLTLGMMSFNHSPGYLVTHYYFSDTVKAWGELKLPYSESDPANTIEVLLVKKHIKTIDSIYIDGEPAPPVFLMFTNMTQGELNENWFYVFYRKAYGKELLHLECDDIDCQNIIFSFYDTEGLEKEPSVYNEKLNSDDYSIKIYPNPVSDNYFFIVNNSKGNKFKLFDLQGKILFEEIIQESGINKINLNKNLNQGIYIAKIYSEGSVFISKIIIKD